MMFTSHILVRNEKILASNYTSRARAYFEELGKQGFSSDLKVVLQTFPTTIIITSSMKCQGDRTLCYNLMLCINMK